MAAGMHDPQSTLDMGDGSNPTAQARLVVIRGPDVGQVLELKGEAARIGRLQDNDMVLRSDTVSRHHAVFRRGPGGWSIEDLRSHNGVLHNSYRIPAERPVPLNHKDTVQLSDVLLLYLAGAMDTNQRKNLATIQMDMGQAEQEGEQAVEDFLRSLRKK